MSRNLSLTTIAQVTGYAREHRVTRVACGYRLVQIPSVVCAFTAQELAWFKRPIGGSL